MILKATGISKQFIREGKGANWFYAVQETDFAVREGALTVLTGRSGSGKSTMLNMLAGLLAPTAGKIFLDETDLYQLNDRELSRLRSRHIGVIPQGQTALHSLNVLENVCLPCTLYGETAGVEACAAELLERLGIGHLGKAMPSELSGGELRRMAIARALVRKPAVILADEPTGDLDDENTEAVLQQLRSLADEGTAVLLVTHEKEAEKYADMVCRMDGGRIYSDEKNGINRKESSVYCS